MNIVLKAFDTDSGNFIDCSNHYISRINNKFGGLGNRYIYLLWTGLKDKNGINIFVGDIVKDADIVYEVRFGEWEMDNVSLVGFYLYNSKYGTGVIGKDDEDVFEIIGNIYQNKEQEKLIYS